MTDADQDLAALQRDYRMTHEISAPEKVGDSWYVTVEFLNEDRVEQARGGTRATAVIQARDLIRRPRRGTS